MVELIHPLENPIGSFFLLLFFYLFWLVAFYSLYYLITKVYSPSGKWEQATWYTFFFIETIAIIYLIGTILSLNGFDIFGPPCGGGGLKC